MEQRQDAATPPMFTPLALRGVTLPNRIGLSPMCMYSADDGHVNDFHLVHLGSRAVGGAGLVMAEMTAVSPEGRISLNDAGIWRDSHIAPWKRVVDFVHQGSDARIGLQLGHAGRKADTGVRWLRTTDRGQQGAGGWEQLAPSAIPYSEQHLMPRAMTEADIAGLIDSYVHAAKRARAAEFDLIELHFAHGYLLSSFISPLTNRRNDGWGGSLEGRMRLPRAVLAAVRAVWPEDKPIAARISAVDWVEGGTTIEDAVEIARMLKQDGLDILDVSTGIVVDHGRPPKDGLGQTPFSERIRRETGIPTMTVGNVQSSADMNAIIADGRADICMMGRGYLFDPYFVRHAARAQDHALAWPGTYASAATITPPAP
ncbi:MAG: NADH:flavin oxidoreductase/NADH oxidase [Alphaproteobacteria bacterium]